MFLLLFVLWLVFNGKITLEITVLGIMICAALYWFLYKFMHYTPKKEWKVYKLLGKIIRYLFYLVLEIVKANLSVSKLILTFKQEPDPILVKFKTNLKTAAGRTAVANSITLTPGTVTVDLETGEFLVHSLKRDYAKGIHESGFVERVGEMEASLEKEDNTHVS